jgi:hypothetical protein
MGARSAGHCNRANAVKFIAKRLPFLPSEEFGERYRFAQG